MDEADGCLGWFGLLVGGASLERKSLALVVSCL